MTIPQTRTGVMAEPLPMEQSAKPMPDAVPRTPCALGAALKSGFPVDDGPPRVIQPFIRFRSLALGRAQASMDGEDMEAISTGSFDAPAFCRAAGAWLYTSNGERYFDGTSGSGAVTLGHQHPRVLDAVRAQLDRVVHTGCKFGSDTRAALMEKLGAFTPFSRPAVLPAVIGTEAVEASLKIARAATGRQSVVCFEHAYHGKSAGALGVTWRERFKRYSSLPRDDVFRASFPPPIEGDTDSTDRVAPYLRALEGVMEAARAAGKPPAAVILEPVQVTEGVLAPGDRFLEGIAAIARRDGALVVFDEIYTGLGRVGRRFYAEGLASPPDLLLIGKSLGNGLPISAVAGEASVINALPEGVQTSTYSGHPLSCAAGVAVLDVVQEVRLWEEATRLGAIVLDKLRALSARFGFVARPRGYGMLLAFDCVEPSGVPSPALAKRFAQAAQRRRLLLFKGGRDECAVKIVPPVLLPDEDLAFLLQALADAAEDVSLVGDA
jgi:4-aminobutyrate aminotransferase/(S)-3-amino-2-methylpropionate transaminase